MATPTLAAALRRIGNSLFKKNYIFKLFFWLDLLATLSLIPDVNFLGEPIFGIQPNIDSIISLCIPGALYDGSEAGQQLNNFGFDDDLGVAADTAQIGVCRNCHRAAAIPVSALLLLTMASMFHLPGLLPACGSAGGAGGQGRNAGGAADPDRQSAAVGP